MNIIKDVETNDILNSTKKLQLGCSGTWSYVQYEAIEGLCDKRKTGMLLGLPIMTNNEARVKLIAQQYARMYLELDEFSNPKYKGRFYWMGLGAFASKQVFCGIKATSDLVSQLGEIGSIGGQGAAHLGDAILLTLTGLEPIEMYNHLPKPDEMPSRRDVLYVKDKLLKGNLWLYLDIYPTHDYYRRYKSSFDACFNKRNFNEYADTPEAPVQSTLKKLLDADNALNEIDYFKYDNRFLKEGFVQIKNYEKAVFQGKSSTTKRDYQMASLLAIAQHEQSIILQSCFYAPNSDGSYDARLVDIFDKQKVLEAKYPEALKFASLFADVQGRQAVLTNSCQIPSYVEAMSAEDKEMFYENMLETENLHVYEERMDFIVRVAEDFHAAMKKHKDLVEDNLTKLSKSKITEWFA